MSAGEIIGIICGIFFGLVFVVTCIVSGIKAVRDRRRIKKRIAEKERVKQEAKLITRRQKVAASIEENYTISTGRIYNEKEILRQNGQLAACTSFTNAGEPTSHRNTNGVDNLTYNHSRTDIEIPLSHVKSKPTAEHYPPNMHVPSKRTLSGDIYYTRDRKTLPHLPTECLAMQKLLRRHSYEVAVCENSWLPTEPPMFASSRSIIQTYNFGNTAAIRTSTVGFVNRAYEDHKKT